MILPIGTILANDLKNWTVTVIDNKNNKYLLLYKSCYGLQMLDAEFYARKKIREYLKNSWHIVSMDSPLEKLFDE